MYLEVLFPPEVLQSWVPSSDVGRPRACIGPNGKKREWLLSTVISSISASASERKDLAVLSLGWEVDLESLLRSGTREDEETDRAFP